MFEPHVLRPERGEEIWVKSLSSNEFEVGVQLDKEQYTYLTITRAQLEQMNTNIHAALLESDLF